MPQNPPVLSEDQQRFFVNPYPSFRALREKPIIWDDAFGFWRITRFADVEAILKDKRFMKNPPEGTALLPTNQADRFNQGILNLDPPDHTRIRGLMVKAFNATRMAAMRPVVNALVEHLLEQQKYRKKMELKQDFAHPIPATIISDMLGIPDEDRNLFSGLSQDIIRFGNDLLVADDAAANQATEQFDLYMTQLLAEKRLRPGDDLTSDLLHAKEHDDALSEEELLHNVRLLFIAGHETTVNLICNATVALFQNPDQLELLRLRPELMPDAVEEFLRFDSSVQQLPRVAQEDVILHGETILAGQMVVLMLGSANHDPATYTDGDTLDVERAYVRSKSFGGGAHFCLGAQLARLETEIAVGKLISDLPGLRVDNLDSLSYPPNPFFRGPDEVHLSWD